MVTDNMVLTALDAYRSCESDIEFHQMHVALLAAAPLIAAVEREENAKIAEMVRRRQP